MPPSSDRGGRRSTPPATAAYGTNPETRKHTEPTASGRHTSRSYDGESIATTSAPNVVTLNATVPASCTPLLHQSALCGCQTTSPGRPPESLRGRSVAATGRAAPAVNSRDPPKNTAASACGPTHARKEGNGATRKHTEPVPKRRASHHQDRCGAQSARSVWVTPRRGGARARTAGGPACHRAP